MEKMFLLFFSYFRGQKVKPESWLFLLTGGDTQSNHSSFKLKQRMRQVPGNLDFLKNDLGLN